MCGVYVRLRACVSRGGGWGWERACARHAGRPLLALPRTPSHAHTHLLTLPHARPPHPHPHHTHTHPPPNRPPTLGLARVASSPAWWIASPRLPAALASSACTRALACRCRASSCTGECTLFLIKGESVGACVRACERVAARTCSVLRRPPSHPLSSPRHTHRRTHKPLVHPPTPAAAPTLGCTTPPRASCSRTSAAPTSSPSGRSRRR